MIAPRSARVQPSRQKAAHAWGRLKSLLFFFIDGRCPARPLTHLS